MQMCTLRLIVWGQKRKLVSRRLGGQIFADVTHEVVLMLKGSEKIWSLRKDLDFIYLFIFFFIILSVDFFFIFYFFISRRTNDIREFAGLCPSCRSSIPLYFFAVNENERIVKKKITPGPGQCMESKIIGT